MTRKIFRLSGVLLGVYLLWIYGSSLRELISIKDGSTQLYLDHVYGLLFAVFLLIPWRFIRSPYVWWGAYFVFWILFLKALSMYLVAVVWADMHGAKGAGVYPIVIGIVALLQLIVIGSMRPKLRKI